jgi:hypothetical protein
MEAKLPRVLESQPFPPESVETLSRVSISLSSPLAKNRSGDTGFTQNSKDNYIPNKRCTN